MMPRISQIAALQPAGGKEEEGQRRDCQRGGLSDEWALYFF